MNDKKKLLQAQNRVATEHTKVMLTQMNDYKSGLRKILLRARRLVVHVRRRAVLLVASKEDVRKVEPELRNQTADSALAKGNRGAA